MKQDYSDITNRLGKPIWWDEAGCPRYEPFQPCMANDFYAGEVALLRIVCQNCGAEYLVCVSSGSRDHRPFRARGQPLTYGDPPRFCCQVGATMTTETVEVVELWVCKNAEWIAQEPRKYFRAIPQEMAKTDMRDFTKPLILLVFLNPSLCCEANNHLLSEHVVLQLIDIQRFAMGWL